MTDAATMNGQTPRAKTVARAKLPPVSRSKAMNPGLGFHVARSCTAGGFVPGNSNRCAARYNATNPEKISTSRARVTTTAINA